MGGGLLGFPSFGVDPNTRLVLMSFCSWENAPFPPWLGVWVNPIWWWPWVLLRMGLACRDELGRWVLKDRIDRESSESSSDTCHGILNWAKTFPFSQKNGRTETDIFRRVECTESFRTSKDILWGTPGSKITMSWKSVIIMWFVFSQGFIIIWSIVTLVSPLFWLLRKQEIRPTISTHHMTQGLRHPCPRWQVEAMNGG